MNEENKLESLQEQLKELSVPSNRRNYNERLSSIRNRMRVKLIQKQIDETRLSKLIVCDKCDTTKSFDW